MTAAVPEPRFHDRLAEALVPILAAHEPWYDDGYLTGEPGFFTCGRFDPSAEPRCEWKSDPDEDDAGHQHRLHLAELIAAEVEARVQAAADQRAALRPFEELFAGDPDTSCRTTWRREPGWSLPGSTAALTECVEVPMDDLRGAFDRAAALASPAPAPQTGEDGQ